MITMRFSKVICVFAVSVLLMEGSAVVYAADACKNVKFQVKNQRDKKIRITKVEYYNADNNATQSEDINPNLECNPGSTCTTNGDNLRDSEGVNLTKFVFFFNDAATQEIGLGVDVGPQRDWQKINRTTQPKVPVNQKCSADRTYSGDPLWTINP